MTGEPRVGIIGSGFMGSTHADAWVGIGVAPSVILGRGSDGDRALAHRLGAKATTSLVEFLAAVDLVDICTPTHLHVPYALAALEARKPTLCEKPLALDVAEGRRVVEGFEIAGVPLAIGHILRHSPEFRAAHARVADGEIGIPAVVRLSRRSFAPRRKGGSWFADLEKSGGIVFDLMIHDLDFARWIAGEVVSVYARSARATPGHAVALLRHAGGTISHVECSWALPAPEFRVDFEIAGSDGLLQYSSGGTMPLEVRAHDIGSTKNTGLGDTDFAPNPFEEQVRAFLRMVDGQGEKTFTPRDALVAVEIASAVSESLESGRPVALTVRAGQ